MAAPRFSIVIPTRNRADTLRFSLETCLSQTFDDYEVVVCDNHSTAETREVVEAAASTKIRYVRSEKSLSMTSNWELAVSQATGEFVTVLGDDDGLLPFALQEADHLIRTRGARIVHWTGGLYTWPNINIPGDANFLRVPLTRAAKNCKSSEKIAEVISFRGLHPSDLPMIYTSFVGREVLESHRNRAGGRIFLTVSPDVYSAFGCAAVVDNYLSIGVPLGLAGLSGHSNGVACLFPKDQGKASRDFLRVSAAEGYVSHPTVPAIPVWATPTADAFQRAKELFFHTMRL